MKNLFLGLLIFSSFQSTAQPTCDCPYPIIFLHGWINSDVWWAPAYDDSDFQQVWGGLADAPNGSDFSPNVFYAMPNAEDTHERGFLGIITSRNDDINGNNGVWNDDGWNDDPKWIFPNHDNQLEAGCLYAINFNNRINGNGEIIPNSALSTAPCNDCSDNNEASIYKQGYLIGKMIDSVLAVNPGKQKVILVGHSMGGLNSREYLQRAVNGIPKWWVDPNSPDGHKVAKLVTLGTPHLGSNVLGNLSNLKTGLGGNKNILPDLNSEAMRDLRYSYDRTFLADYPGPYLYGGYEDDIPTSLLPYHSKDVNCDGDQDDTVIGINVDGLTAAGGNKNFSWDGTYDNPNMPLPTNVRYTWYCSNIIGAGGGDGAVDDQRMWLYQGGDGTTNDFNNGNSIPVPLDGIPYRLSDRITSPNSVNHIQQQGDVTHMVRCLDEGDYPAFAWDIEMNHTYAGMTQILPNKSPADGNRANGEDKDWYVFEVNETTVGFRIALTPTPLRAGRIDFYESPADYEIGNATTGMDFLANGTPSEVELQVNSCLEPGQKYYVRISHNQVAIDDWKSPFKLRIEPRGVMLNARVFLEGPMDNGLMSDNLRVNGFLPVLEPFTALGFTQVGSGGEMLNPALLNVVGTEAVVDWIFVEIRDLIDPRVVVATQPALLLRNGDIVNPTSGCPLFFGVAEGEYYVALRHRNHLDIMTGTSVSLRAGEADLLDFSDASTMLYPSTSQTTDGGIQAMWAADATLDDLVNAADRSATWNFRNQTGYILADLNLDGITNAADRSMAWNNRNATTVLPF